MFDSIKRYAISIAMILLFAKACSAKDAENGTTVQFPIKPLDIQSFLQTFAVESQKCQDKEAMGLALASLVVLNVLQTASICGSIVLTICIVTKKWKGKEAKELSVQEKLEIAKFAVSSLQNDEMKVQLINTYLTHTGISAKAEVGDYKKSEQSELLSMIDDVHLRTELIAALLVKRNELDEKTLTDIKNIIESKLKVPAQVSDVSNSIGTVS